MDHNTPFLLLLTADFRLKNRSEEQSKEFRQLKAGQRSAGTYQKRRATQIEQSEQRLLSYEEQLSNTLREVSRLDTLIEQRMVRLRTEKKHLMDVIKITARNLFYQVLKPFRKRYDNFRDDHVWLRHLTEITGFIDACDQVKCHLIKNADYPKSVHEVIEETLALFNLNSAVKLAIFHNLLLHKAFQNWLEAPKGAPSHFGNTF